MRHNPLNLIYITNNPVIAEIAQSEGVDSIMVDLETIGKDQRQRGLDTVKSRHCINDIAKIKQVINKSEVIVRVNPLYTGSKTEIDQSIDNGADSIMLPMFRTTQEVEQFIRLLDGRAKSLLLLETKAACESLDSILRVSGIDRIHIGLNDLHLDLKLKFMFELLINGYVDNLSSMIGRTDIPFGIGGIARPGKGLIPAEMIIAEHIRLGSSSAILSREFLRGDNAKDFDNLNLADSFHEGIQSIREVESNLAKKQESFFRENHTMLAKQIERIISNQ